MNLPVGHLVLDDDCRIRAASARAAEWLGYADGELIGVELTHIVAGPTRLFFSTQILPALAEGRHVEEAYVSFTTKSGDTVPAVLYAERHPGANGGPSTTDCVFLPMRRRRLFERELIAAKRAAEDSARAEHAVREEMRVVEERLAHRERLASLGTLAAGMAHELNNPLAYVSANVELVAERLGRGTSDGTSELLGLLAEAGDGVARIRSIVSSLQVLTRSDAEPVGPVDLTRSVHGALKLVEHRVRTRAQLVVDVEPDLHVLGNEIRLGQVVQNLLVNAADAFPEAAPDKNRITLRAARGEDAVVLLEVCDNGPGIAPEAQRRIFDPFFTTKPIGVGTGLGLSICHGIVTAAGGSITVESAPAHGACFHVRLRVAPGSDARAEAPRATTPALDASTPSDSVRRRVLVIDDDATIARVVARCLSPWEIVVETSGERGLARLRSDDHFDLVVCDLMMPHVSGKTLFDQIAGENPSLAHRFLFLTGGACDEESRLFLTRCGRPHLIKPFRLADLRRAAESLSATAVMPRATSRT